MAYSNQSKSPFGGIISIIFFLLFFVALFYVAKFMFMVLWYASPVIFIAALLLDFKGVTNYGKWLINLGKRNLVAGVGATLLSMIAFPLVALFLLGKALFKKKVKEMQGQFETPEDRSTQGEEGFIEYEEVVDEPKLELPPLRRPEKARKKENEYDTFFDE
ncbi:MAG: hypothetical protein ACI9XO_003428 [Paraglaciecola sp.]|jgi:hypothetical protein